MKTFWLKRWGWIYRPVHPAGIVIAMAALAVMYFTRKVDWSAHDAGSASCVESAS